MTRFCRCTSPSPQVVEGFQVCANCGDRLPDPLMLLIAKQQREIAQQQREILTRLEGLEEGSEERQPDSGLLEPAELAERLGKSRAWVYEHSEDLGAIRLGRRTTAAALLRPRTGPWTTRLAGRDQ